MNKDSRGFTLIELIVVIVILGVMAAVISISVSTVPATRAKGCASTINTTLDRARAGSLTHAQVSYMVISQDSGGSYEIACYDNGTRGPGGYSGGSEISSRSISGGGLTISYLDGSTSIKIVNKITDYNSQVNSLKIGFNRSGALGSGSTDAGGNCVITVSGGGRSYTITVVGATGSHEIS